MDATDISGAASQPANAAKVVIQLFQQGRPHAMPVWHEAAAVQHFNKFQGSLGLGPRAEDSLLAAVMSVSSTLSEPNGLQELSKVVPSSCLQTIHNVLLAFQHFVYDSLHDAVD